MNQQRQLYYKPYSQFAKQMIAKERKVRAKKFLLSQDTRIQTEPDIPSQQQYQAETIQSPIALPKHPSKKIAKHPIRLPSLGYYNPKYDLVWKSPKVAIIAKPFNTTRSNTFGHEFLDPEQLPKEKIKGSVDLSKQTQRSPISNRCEGPHPERFSLIHETEYATKKKKIPRVVFSQSPRSIEPEAAIERSYDPKYDTVRKNLLRGVLKFEKSLGREQKQNLHLSYHETSVSDYEYQFDSPTHSRQYTFLFQKFLPRTTHQALPSYMNKLNASRLQLETVGQKMLELNGSL